MLVTTFETLPDEILMIIIQYSGDIFTIFEALSGLNQRITNILLDKRMYLLTDFLFMDKNDINIDYYYESDLFYDINQQLVSEKVIKNNQQFRQCLQSLVAFHIKNKYYQSIDQLELDLAQFQSIRMDLTDDEIHEIDEELEKRFRNLKDSSYPMNDIKQIQFLVRTKGARLECSDDENVDFNLADAINCLLLHNMNKNQPTSQQYISSLVQMFKSLIISNLKLLHNRSYSVNAGCVIYYFLFHAIYRCQCFNCQESLFFLNIQYYQATVDLLLFVLQCLNYEFVAESWWVHSYMELLQFIPSIEFPIEQEIIIYTSQREILQILFNENILVEPISSDLTLLDSGSKYLGHLFTCSRLDMILFILHNNEQILSHFQSSWDDPNFIGITTGNPMRRRLLHTVLDDELIGTWLGITTNLLFILLQKKECKLVKKLISISPSLINRLDDDDNDPLLYVCLKVRGSRHRLIEYLIKIGCDTQRKNLNNVSFMDTLQLERNRKLLKNLIEHEIIEINPDSGEIKTNFT